MTNTSYAAPAGVRFKGTVLSCVVLEIGAYTADGFARELQEQVARAPEFFTSAPCLLSLEKFAGDLPAFPILQALESCAAASVRVIGLRAGSPETVQLAQIAGLPCLETADPRQSRQRPAEREPGGDTDNDSAAATPTPTPTRVIRQPVRSGQQVCAPDGDLIVLAPVSTGAEVLAAGNIHLYAPLRGRALAGIHGDTTARIFCQSLEAELIAIAGCYRIVEQTGEAGWKQSVVIEMFDDRLVVNPLPAARAAG